MKQLVRVFFFGDSICFGQGVSIHKGWVPRISAKLEELSIESGFNVLLTNASLNGNTTRLALERMPYDIQSQHPDILVVQFGMNDCNYWESDRGLPRVSLNAFEANLKEIIDRASRFGVSEVLLNTNHPTAKSTLPMVCSEVTYEQSNALYSEAVRRVAAGSAQNVVFNDVREFFLQNIGKNGIALEELLLPAPDLLHLSERGHDLYYSLMAPRVEAAIRRVIARKM